MPQSAAAIFFEDVTSLAYHAFHFMWFILFTVIISAFHAAIYHFRFSMRDVYIFSYEKGDVFARSYLLHSSFSFFLRYQIKIDFLECRFVITGGHYESPRNIYSLYYFITAFTAYYLYQIPLFRWWDRCHRLFDILFYLLYIFSI